jgi:hypothetical protein
MMANAFCLQNAQWEKFKNYSRIVVQLSIYMIILISLTRRGQHGDTDFAILSQRFAANLSCYPTLSHRQPFPSCIGKPTPVRRSRRRP